MDFDTAINRVLSAEGGYVNRPEDPGGETKWGISKRSYPDLDIQNLTRDQAIEIYKRDFWLKAQADKLPDSVAFQALDFAVNSGIVPSIGALQRAAGCAPDGHVGPHTLEALLSKTPHDLVVLYIAERIDFMRSLKNWPTEGKGWMGRMAMNLRYSAEDVD